MAVSVLLAVTAGLAGCLDTWGLLGSSSHDDGATPTAAVAGGPDAGSNGNAPTTPDVDSGTDPSTPDGSPAADAGSAPVAIAKGVARPHWVVLDADAVYWLEEGKVDNGGIRRAQISRWSRATNGTPVVVSTGIPNGQSLAQSGNRLYWSADISGGGCSGRIGSVNKDGTGETSDMMDCNQPWVVRADATNIYFITWNTQIARSPKPAGNAVFLTGTAVTGHSALALDATRIYFDRAGSQSLNYIDKADPGAAMHVFAGGQNAPVAIETDSTSVYWITDPGGTVAKLDRNKPGTPPVILATGLANPTSLALDSTYVYVTTAGDGVVARVPKAGGALTPIATNQTFPCGIAADDHAIVWTNCDGGTVMLATQ